MARWRLGVPGCARCALEWGDRVNVSRSTNPPPDDSRAAGSPAMSPPGQLCCSSTLGWRAERALSTPPRPQRAQFDFGLRNSYPLIRRGHSRHSTRLGATLAALLAVAPAVAPAVALTDASASFAPTVSAKRTTRVAAARPVAALAKKDVEKVAAAVTVGVGAMMANPLVAEAAVTPSLKNLLNSVVAGGVVLGGIAVAVSAVSSFDRIRKE